MTSKENNNASNTLSYYYPIAKSIKKKSTTNEEKPLQSKKVAQPEVLNEEEQILVEFDMNYEYGPSQNLTRLERWDRASKLNLNPPQKIKELILSNQSKYLNPVWVGYPILN